MKSFFVFVVFFFVVLVFVVVIEDSDMLSWMKSYDEVF